eukprot:TRINITY_DN236_c0_g1_i14.p1 TRINITY_DN236_c0_g1~~TRINITY_DN236_c0_g1_i14.p1  ORF type:complete len:445 (-),score=122.94 TRINITY_DN236_c0_g1_i14:468-1613(-)
MTSTRLKSETEELLHRIAQWEQSVSGQWSETEATEYYEKKKEVLSVFFNDQQEREVDRSRKLLLVQTAVKRQEAELREREAKQAREKAEEVKAEYSTKTSVVVQAKIETEISSQARVDAEAHVRQKAEAVQVEIVNAERAIKAEADAQADVTTTTLANGVEITGASAKDDSPAELILHPIIGRSSSGGNFGEIDGSRSPLSPRALSIAREDLEDAARAAAAADAALEKEMKEAMMRISKQPSRQQADLTDPVIISTYIRVRNHRDELNWMMIGYADNLKTNKLSVIGCGSGGWNELLVAIPEDAVYIYLDYKFGDTARSKFVFITYVPDSLSSLKKSRVVGHRPAVEKLLKYMQISWHVLEKHDLKRYFYASYKLVICTWL